jgi:tetratricopeptide (TPR) repeat protein
VLFALVGLTVIAGRPALEQARLPHKPGSQWHWLLAGTGLVLITVTLLFWRPLLGAWYANMGAIYQTRAELSPYLDDSSRARSEVQAIWYYERALNIDSSQPVANRRFGTMALDRQAFDTAVTYLERAYVQEPANQATLKALGYAYLWTDQLSSAEKLLRQVDNQAELVEELATWQWWWSTRNEPALSHLADKMVQRLSPDEDAQLNQIKR